MRALYSYSTCNHTYLQACAKSNINNMFVPNLCKQFMWGEMVRRAGVGPEPLPADANIRKGDDESAANEIAERLRTLADPNTKKAAEELSQKMALEDGIVGGLEHFLDDLPRENMLCDVSLLLGEIEPARYHINLNGLKVSVEVAAMIEIMRKFRHGNEMENIWPALQKTLQSFALGDIKKQRHSVTTYNLRGQVTNFFQGSFSSIYILIHETIRAPFQLYFKPDQFARTGGACGCLFGIVVGAFAIIGTLLGGILQFIDYGWLASEYLEPAV